MDRKLNSIVAWVGVVVLALFLWVGFALVQVQRGQNEYAITNDSTVLQGELLARGNMRRIVKDGATDNLAMRDLNIALKFYLAVYRQAQAGAVSSGFADHYARDFCGFVVSPNIDKAWLVLVETKFVGDAIVEMRRDWCGDAA